VLPGSADGLDYIAGHVGNALAAVSELAG